ncbi:MAG: hypothetical protein A3I75_05205 [Deltaproteobacteria bacterium RIFCSPLOWO2_02_FULL_50_16]|nr:MAG: hypothetical protein A3I75_05205 [Deltaproteobacteria bacterium RIFCSPLOWO2_02_FULL_50_16]
MSKDLPDRTENGLYLYGVSLGASNGDQLSEKDLKLKGLLGGGIFTLASRGLTAVVQECDSSFSTEDPKRVSEWVLIHQSVVDAAWEKFETIIPFGFGTVIVSKEGRSARENLIDWLAREGESLKRKLEKLKGRAEYGIQISWNPELMVPRVTKNDVMIQRLKEEICSKAPGTAYLLKQRLENLLSKRLEIAADAYFKEFYQKLSGCVEQVRVEKVRKEEAPLQMLMNLSCLTEKRNLLNLSAELDKLSKIEGFFVRFTGPWPPYSFVSV